MSVKKSSVKKPERKRASPVTARSKKPSATTRPTTTRVQKRGSGVRRPTSAGTSSEESRAKLDELQDRLGDLQESLLLTSAHSNMGDLETALSLLPAEIEELRLGLKALTEQEQVTLREGLVFVHDDDHSFRAFPVCKIEKICVGKMGRRWRAV